MSTATKTTERQSLQTVQVLRGLSALLVLVFHTSEVAKKKLGMAINASLGFGHAGVDFFFVLSGFIICYVHFSDLGRPDRLKSYFLKRIVRVCPLYWVITGAIVTASLAGFSFAGEANLSFKRIATSFLFIPQAEKPILGVGWTLTHEMFFYALFSLIIWLPPRAVLPPLGAWLLGIVIRIFAFPNHLDSVALQFVFSEHNLQFAIGCLVGWVIVKGRRVNPRRWLFSGAVLFLGSGLIEVFLDLSLNAVLQYGVASALMLIGAACGDLENGWNPPRWLVAIGAASYSIYLVHLAALNLLVLVAKKAGLLTILGTPITVIAIACGSFVVGLVTHRWIERPLLEIGRQWLLMPRKA